jgi:drug/metabolite transporter (DMT)-like permease
LVTENKEYLDLKAILIMLALTMLWGFNYTAVKYSNQDWHPSLPRRWVIIASLPGDLLREKKRGSFTQTSGYFMASWWASYLV